MGTVTRCVWMCENIHKLRTDKNIESGEAKAKGQKAKQYPGSTVWPWKKLEGTFGSGVG